jgi:hypothetical protein
MNKIEGIYREVIEKSEWFAIATTGPDGPHLAASWTRYVLALGIDSGEILIPAGSYKKTEENLQRDPRVELLFAAGDVRRPGGVGQGCSVIGKGELQATGPKADATKVKFPWARGVLVVKVGELKTHLP